MNNIQGRLLFYKQRSVIKLYLSFLCACFSASAICQQAYWQQQVNYKIDVSLDDKLHTLDGFEKIEYINNSPDTLRFIWFHLWPNAYKNDKTAFSDQLLENDDTKFYFSDKEERGYINRLDFKVDNVTAETEDHPQHIDIIKVILPFPLPPAQRILITTPFHVKLPGNFSRSGHEGQSYQVTQWYPKPAVYDKNGWHPMPYLDQGEFYSEFGNFEVNITVPENYVVAATGELQNQGEKQWLDARANFTWQPSKRKVKTKGGGIKTITEKFPPSSNDIKILTFKQENVHDFAWFADKRFIVNHDTCMLAPGKKVDVYAYYTIEEKDEWKNSTRFAKDALRTRSEWIGEYPFKVVSVVQGPESISGGMEYPTITILSPLPNEQLLDFTIAHEIGHNWFYAILGSNERKYPWMDEGFNTYYDNRYSEFKYGDKGEVNIVHKTVPIKSIERILFETKATLKQDQPINSSSDTLTLVNYELSAYYKTGAWLEYLATLLGTGTVDKAMQAYYNRWQFKHPQPGDFRKVMEETSGRNMDSLFSLLDQKGILPNQHRTGTRIHFIFAPGSKTSYINHPVKQLISFGPAIGGNSYDKFMIGGFITNYKLPPSRFNFLLVPLYATGSEKLVGLGHLGYSFYPDKGVQKIQAGLGGMFFSKRASKDSFNNNVFEEFYRVTPSLKLTFRNRRARSTFERTLEAKSFIIGEKDFDGFAIKSTDSLTYVTSSEKDKYYINQLSFTEVNYRKLYPYQYTIQLQQGEGFYRANFIGNYFFNYAKGGGVNLRFFAAKFGYLGDKNKYQFTTQRYQPKLLGVTGEEDYTYSDYFIGRTASYANDPEAVTTNRGVGTQQIMIRDGAFKLRLDQYDFLQGRSENWVAAINLNTTLPRIFPFELPLKIFLDLGTYSEAWQKGATTDKFLYVSGIQLSLFKDFINIYAPILYSKEFKDNLKSLPEQNTFLKRLTFSINVSNFDFRKFNRHLSF